MKLVFISDTHDLKIKEPIPDGDVLVHCGDICGEDSPKTIERFNEWMGSLPHPHKIVIAGNHEIFFERENEHARSLMTNVTYLEDEEVVIDGIKFYGSPWQPWFYDWAYNLPRGEPLRKKWALIPEDTDVLVTHGPPFSILDKNFWENKQTGCRELLKRVMSIRPKIHAFGHIHEGYGTKKIDKTIFVNASICTVFYEPINKPILVEI
ncbi:MAG: metallophosphatase domain-containing protein [Candidatus Hodarchaeales archaeon]